jgi:hypothetical protein
LSDKRPEAFFHLFYNNSRKYLQKLLPLAGSTLGPSFTCINTVGSHNMPRRQELLWSQSSPSYRWENCGIQRFSNFQPVSQEARICLAVFTTAPLQCCVYAHGNERILALEQG